MILLNLQVNLRSTFQSWYVEYVSNLAYDLIDENIQQFRMEQQVVN